MKDLILSDLGNSLTKQPAEYKSMLKNIDAKMPAVEQGITNFNKSHSQFMGVMLDVTPLTPIRSIKHTLAEINNTKDALQSTFIKLKKSDIKYRKKEAKLAKATDPFERELLEVQMLELRSNKEKTQGLVNAALRKLNFFMNQHDLLMKKIGKTELTEEDYEREECRYHIMTAMKQGLNAARSRNGVIDEGNMIYIFDLGINAADAQAEVLAYLNLENKIVSEGNMPTHAMTLKWLEHCADKWAHCPTDFASHRGFETMDSTSLANPALLKKKNGATNGAQAS
jgi:hypothetical protein